MGQPGRPGQAAGHRSFLRDRRQQPGLVFRLDRPDEHQPGQRQALRRRLPGGDRRGLGRRASAADGRARHRADRRGDRRQPRRHAGARLGTALPDARTTLHRGGDGAEPVGAEHRVQRGGAPRDRHRPRVPRRSLLRAWRDPAARAARGPHDRPHHVPQRRRDGAEVRSHDAQRQRRQPARCRHRRRAGLCLQHAGHRVPDRELPAPPGRQVQRILRCEHVFADHARARLLRPGTRLRRRPDARLRERTREVPDHQLHDRLAFFTGTLARDREGAARQPARRQLCGDRRAARPRRVPARRPAISRRVARTLRQHRGRVGAGRAPGRSQAGPHPLGGWAAVLRRRGHT